MRAAACRCASGACSARMPGWSRSLNRAEQCRKYSRDLCSVRPQYKTSVYYRRLGGWSRALPGRRARRCPRRHVVSTHWQCGVWPGRTGGRRDHGVRMLRSTYSACRAGVSSCPPANPSRRRAMCKSRRQRGAYAGCKGWSRCTECCGARVEAGEEKSERIGEVGGGGARGALLTTAARPG